MAFVEDRHKRKDGTRKPGYGTGLRWRVVWQDGGSRRTKSFKNRSAAEQHKTLIEHQQYSGTYVPQEKRRALIGDLLPEWEASLIRLKPSTRREVTLAVRSRIAPKWGMWQVGAVGRRDVQDWVYALHEEGLAPRTVDTVYGRLRGFYAWCVTEGHVPVSPCQNVTLPRGHNKEHLYLSPAEVRALLEHMHPHYRLLTEFLVTTGLRFGEAAELRVKDLDLGRRRANVNRAVTRGVVGVPKSYKRRSVPLTESVAAQLAERVAGLGREDLLFTTTRGSQVGVDMWRVRHFRPAVVAAGLPAGLTPHALRHTTASLLTRSGGSIKALQNMLGHANAEVTLSTYSGLYSDELDDLGGRIGELLGAPDGHPNGEHP